MTAQEMVGRTRQATKSAREALAANTEECTPSKCKSLVTAINAEMDIADAQAEFFGNGLTDSIATQVAEKIREKKPLTINGRDFQLPDAATIWRVMIILSVIVTGSINGCRQSRGIAPTAATAAVAATAPTAAVAAPARLSIDPATIALLRELLRDMNGSGTNGL